MTTPIRIGTRGSNLALWQANYVADCLRPLAAPRPVELVLISTAGDQVRDVPLAQIGGEGVFTKEIQRALLEGTVDVTVHSLKDLPTIPVEGLTLAAVPQRGPAGDVFISERYRRFDELPRGAVLATSSIRRRTQVLYRRPDLQLIDIRGNVETRLRKLHESAIDGTILAEAGLVRLGLESAMTEILDPSWMLPAVGQGALGLEGRADDRDLLALLGPLNHLPTRLAVLAERALLRALGGGCQVPMGAIGHVDGDVLTLRGALVSPDGKQRIEAVGRGPAADPEAIGQRLAADLRDRGAANLWQVP